MYLDFTFGNEEHHSKGMSVVMPLESTSTKCLESMYMILKLNIWMLEIYFINQEHVLSLQRTIVWFPDIRGFSSACKHKSESTHMSSMGFFICGHIPTETNIHNNKNFKQKCKSLKLSIFFLVYYVIYMMYIVTLMWDNFSIKVCTLRKVKLWSN